MTLTSHEPPHNTESEEQVIGGLLLYPIELYDEAARKGLMPSSFYSPTLGLIYAAIEEIIIDDHVPDIAAVTDKLRIASSLTDVGGPMFLVGLADSVSSTASFSFHLNNVTTDAKRRRLMGGTYELIQSLLDRKPFSESYELLDNLALREGKTMGGGLHDDKAIEMIASGTASSMFIPTGMKGLDNYTGGLSVGDITTLGAASQLGKSAWAHSAVSNIVRSNTASVFILSPDSPKLDVWLGMACRAARVNFTDASLNRLDPDTKKKLHTEGVRIVREEIRPRLWIDDLPVNTSQLQRRIEKGVSNSGASVVIVDTLQRISSTSNKIEGQIKATEELKSIARECNVAMLVLSQLRREAEERAMNFGPNSKGDPRPDKGDLAWGTSTWNDSKQVWFLWRPSYYGLSDDIKAAEILVRKMKHGTPRRDIPLIFEGAYLNYYGR